MTEFIPMKLLSILLLYINAIIVEEISVVPFSKDVSRVVISTSSKINSVDCKKLKIALNSVDNNSIPVYVLENFKTNGKILIAELNHSILKENTDYIWTIKEEEKYCKYNVLWIYKYKMLIPKYDGSELANTVSFLNLILVYTLLWIFILLFRYYKDVIVVEYLKTVKLIEDIIRREREEAANT